MQTNQGKLRVVTPDRIANQIRLDIITQKYAAGTKVAETELAAQFNASRSSVRTALQSLEGEGLITTLPNGRREIAEFSFKQLQDLFDFRWMVENRALEIIMNNKHSFYPMISRVLEKVEEYSINGPEDTDWYDLDIQFHRALVASSDNRALLNAWESNVPVIYSLMNLNASKGYREQYVAEFLDKHRNLYEHMILGNEVCFAELKKHILDAESIANYVLSCDM